MVTVRKLLESSIIKINLGLLVMFASFFLFASQIEYHLNSLAVAVGLFGLVLFSSSVVIALGIDQFRVYKEYLKVDDKAKRLRTAELVPNILGFVFMGLGAGLESIVIQRSADPTMHPYLAFIHPYSSVALALFVAGMFFFVVSTYFYGLFLPKQVAGPPPT